LTGLERKISQKSIDVVLFAKREAGLEAKAEKMLGVSVWEREYRGGNMTGEEFFKRMPKFRYSGRALSSHVCIHGDMKSRLPSTH
jgi:hypothetical protein